MIQFAICDDSAVFVETLKNGLNNILLSISDGVDYELHTFTSSNDLLEYSAHTPINILFLDIDMPKLDGFGIAASLQKSSPDTMIIFVSAYDSFVFDSFQFSPLGFIIIQIII